MSRSILPPAEKARRRKLSKARSDAKHKDKRAAYMRAWRLEHPGYSTPYVRAWRAQPKGKQNPLTGVAL